MKPRDGGWYDWPVSRGDLYGKTVHEKEPETKPVLYDAKGKPLVRAKRPVGFEPPEKRP